MKYKLTPNKCWKHFCIITKHKLEVMKACFKAGLIWQGITHDLSKYLPSEFIEYAKYYNGKISPVDLAKKETGRCDSWLHHRGRNKHHYEYWIDNLDSGGTPLVMPNKYLVEMICDWIGAGKVYQKEVWTNSMPLNFWENKKKTAKIHPSTQHQIDKMLKYFARTGDYKLKYLLLIE